MLRPFSVVLSAFSTALTPRLTYFTQRLYKQRAGLKQSDLKGIFINEDLTKLRSKLLYDARTLVKSQPPCLQGAWSTDGRILVKDLRGKVHRVSSHDELDVVKNIR